MNAPTLTCCRPAARVGPSGKGYWHRSNCPRFPDQKCITPRSKSDDRLNRQHRMETARTGVITDLRPRIARLPIGAVHPACLSAHADGGTPCSVCIPRLHLPGCECDPCQYDRNHSDDADDNGVSWI